MSSRHSSSWIDTNIFEYKIHTTINTSGVPTSSLFTSPCCRRWKTSTSHQHHALVHYSSSTNVSKWKTSRSISWCLVKSMHHHDFCNLQTHHLINEEAFAKMKDDVVLVNTRWTSSWSKNKRRQTWKKERVHIIHLQPRRDRPSSISDQGAGRKEDVGRGPWCLWGRKEVRLFFIVINEGSVIW